MNSDADRLCWVKVTDIPNGTNAEDVGHSLRVPQGKSATVREVIWTSARRTEALLCISGLGAKGQMKLTELNPLNLSMVATPPDRLSSANPVASLIPTRDETEKGLPNLLTIGQPLSVPVIPQRVPLLPVNFQTAEHIRSDELEQFKGDQGFVETPSNLEECSLPAMDTEPAAVQSQHQMACSCKTDEFPYQPNQQPLATTGVDIPGRQRSCSSPPKLGIQSRTVRFEGVDETWDRDDFELALDNEEKGGGEIEEDGIVMKWPMVYVTFKDAAVAQRVVAKGNWRLMNRNVKVTLVVREPDPLEELLQTYSPANTVVLRGIPMKTSRQALLTHIAANTHLEEGNDFKLEEKNGTALVGLEAHCILETFMKQISVPKHYLSDSTPVPLQATRLCPVDSILLTKVDDKWCDIKRNAKLQLYFSNKAKSGSGGAEHVEIKGRGKAVVSLTDSRDLMAVLDRSHSALGPDVTVCLYHPILSEWTAPSTGAESALLPVQHQPFNYPISDTLYKHLSKFDIISTINAQLRDCCAETKLPLLKPSAIAVHPITGSEWMPDWYQSCEQVISNFLGMFAEVVIDVPPDVAQEVLQTLLFSIQNTAVTVDQIEGSNQRILVGRKEDIAALKSKLDRIISEKHDTAAEVKLPLAQLVYIDVCLRGALSSLHPSVTFSVNMQKGTLQVRGTAPNVEEFICSAQKAECVTKELRLPFPALNLLASYDGRQILQKHILDYRLGYFFVSEDGSIPISDLVPVVAIHLVAETNQNLSSAGDRLSAAIAVDSMNTAKEFKTVVRSREWEAMKAMLQQRYVVYIQPEPSHGKVHLASLAEHMEDVKADLLQFLIKHCFMAEAILLHKGQAEYLQKYCTEWMQLQLEMQAENIRCLVQPNKQNMEVRLNGETSPVKISLEKVQKCIQAIAFGEMHVNAPMAVKYLQSESGEHQVTGIASRYKASIQVMAMPQSRSEANSGTNNAPSPFGSLQAPLQREICVGTVSEGGMPVSIMHGDLTEFRVDVMVNAANENLNHAGGIARELVRKGGDVIQEASTSYVRLRGKVEKGRAVLTKAVGKLPCQAIVHTVGPRWNGGMENEQHWIKMAAYASLREARDYTTVAFPALSTGVFRVPVDVSAQGMLDGIVAFAKENPRSSIEKVTIMLYQEEHIDSFVARAVTCLCDVMIMDQRFKKYTARKAAVSRSELDAVVPTAAIFKSLQVKKGNLREQQVDVYVNSSNSALDLTNSGLGTGGQQLRETCKEHIRRHGYIPNWGTVTTWAGNLKCKRVIHAVMGDCRQSVEDSKQDMADMMKRILQECDRLMAKSVAIPTLGTGARGFPCEVAAEIIIQAVVVHLGDNPATSIKDVILALNNDDVHTAFQAVYTQMRQEAAELTRNREAIKRLHSHFLNDVSVEILSGDIEEVECAGRVLVSTAEDVENDNKITDLLLSDEDPLLDVSLGPYHCLVMEEYSLMPQEVRVMRLPQDEMLKCREILQVLTPSGLEDCQQTVLNLLQTAEKEELESVAFPASMLKLAGHNLDQSQVVGAIYAIITAFIKDNEQHSVKSISVVLPEEKHRTNRPGSSNTDERSNADSLCIGVFSGSRDGADRVIGEIKKLIDDKFHCEEIRDERIEMLAVKSTEQLQQKASQAGVNFAVRGAPQNVIIIEGDKTAVTLMTTIVQEELERAQQEERFISKVQWQHRDVTGRFQNYPYRINWNIEEAFQRKDDDIVILSIEERTQLIDFEKKMQHCLEQPFTVTDVRRQDIQREGDLPPYWDPMPTDAYENCKAVALPPDSHEYKEVADLFSRTMQPGVNVPGITTPYEKIVRIKRIQNRALHLQYTGRKQAMQCQNPPDHMNEWKLWHGCSNAVVKQINQGGFNRSFATTQGNAYGRGVYFARDASIAAHNRYSPRDEHRHKHIYLARVLVGEYTVGNCGLIVPPPKDPNNPVVLYDSVVDNQMDPHVFCIFQDSQAYPDYHIEFC